QITALIADGRRVESAQAGEAVEVILDVTPFYAAGGGQIADTGVIAGSAGQVVVDEVERIGQRTIVHRGRVSEGRIQAGDQVTAVVDAARRTATAGHHTATHLLHKALHEVLGRHAKQAGSLVAPDRLRFDFSHFEPIAPDELDAIERDVNEKIRLNLPVTTTVTDYESAVGAGAMALFGEKYGDRVRLVTIGDYSKELCGGTHVRASGDLGFFKIVSEGGVAAGVRRIEALAGEAAVGYVKSLERQLDETARQLGAHGGDVVAAAERVRAELQAAQRESARLRDRLAQLESLALLDRTENIGPTSVLIAPVADYTGDLAVLGDQLKARLDEYVIVLGARQNGKANFVAMASDGAIARGLKAGDIVREAAAAAGGKGGGRPQMGKGGGPQAERLEEGLQRAKEAIMRQLSVSRTH
ncbi:MAG TPA: DHHA1 domain-containing protein, partial [Limnochordia bacterium]|nr:DHHA1 domain-containing protein [Limnochordia bacterium]